MMPTRPVVVVPPRRPFRVPIIIYIIIYNITLYARRTEGPPRCLGDMLYIIIIISTAADKVCYVRQERGRHALKSPALCLHHIICGQV
jgi:hypothetical protein